MLGASRVIHAVGKDNLFGLVFRPLNWEYGQTRNPVVSVLFTSLVIALLFFIPSLNNLSQVSSSCNDFIKLAKVDKLWYKTKTIFISDLLRTLSAIIFGHQRILFLSGCVFSSKFSTYFQVLPRRMVCPWLYINPCHHVLHQSNICVGMPRGMLDHHNNIELFFSRGSRCGK